MIWWIFLLVWTIVSIWYFIANFGNKNKKSRFPKSELVLGLPVLIIAYIYGFVFSFLPKQSGWIPLIMVSQILAFIENTKKFINKVLQK